MTVKINIVFFIIFPSFCLDVEDENKFISIQERQSIVSHLLYSIRVVDNETIDGIDFKVDQSLSK